MRKKGVQAKCILPYVHRQARRGVVFYVPTKQQGHLMCIYSTLVYP